MAWCCLFRMKIMLSSACTESRTCQLLTLPCQKGVWRCLLGRGCSFAQGLAGYCIGQLTMSNCVVHDFFVCLFVFCSRYSFLITIFFTFTFLIKISLSQPVSSQTFTFFNSFPHPTRGDEQLTNVWCLAIWRVKSQQHFLKKKRGRKCKINIFKTKAYR